MRRRRQVLDALDIGRPANGRGILRPGNDEPRARSSTCRLYEQLLECGLSVLAVGSKIAQMPSCFGLDRSVKLRIDGAIKRRRARTAVDILDQVQHRSAGEGQI